MSFEPVYDVNEAGYRQWRFSAAGLIFVVIGVGILIYRRRSPSPARTPLAELMPFLVTGFSTLWVIVTFISTFSEYRSLSAALRSGRIEVVEGRVTDFVPAPPRGHAMERFRVNGRSYEYADGVITAGFHTTRAQGGPIHEGAVVRIADVGGKIARLEVAR